ncbi:hypothetical protein [uncultured Jatrophihabitans sp.]|uniref:hypothetical protein n=1 Tax=uncultured Jatrophihabitans sp. TaxID=1610747 RepID=UPI0035C9BF4A
MPQDEPRRRGRPARAEPARGTGYRCTDPVRRQLTIASAFLNEPNLQGVIDRAVREYLARLHDNLPGFADATAAAERTVAGGADNVTELRGKRT